VGLDVCAIGNAGKSCLSLKITYLKSIGLPKKEGFRMFMMIYE